MKVSEIRFSRFLFRRWEIAVGVSVLALSIFAPPVSAVPDNGECRAVSVPVAMAEGHVPDQTVAATLCTPATWAPGERAVDVLVSGGTYDGIYWDWPQHPEIYSYARHTLGAGRAALYFDKLGTGASTKPPSSELSVPVDAFVVHQLIDWVRGQGYQRVNGVGHSLGSVIFIEEAARWSDIDRLAVTGLLHLPALGPDISILATAFYPAHLDPKFADTSDIGYLTSRPGTRFGSFYHPATADPAVVALDEETKSTFTVQEYATSVPQLVNPPESNPTSRIKVPVLIVMGTHDGLFCGFAIDCTSPEAIHASERAYYPQVPDFDVAVVPETGHDLALHPSAPETFDKIDRWISTGNP